MIADPLFYLAAAPAVLLMGLSKGGFAGLGLLSLPLLALVVSPVQAAAIMLPILIAQDVVTVWAYRRAWDSRNLAILLPGAALGIGLGYLLAARVSDAAVALAVGAISIAFAVRRLVVERGGAPPPTTPGLAAGGFWGVVCGFTSGSSAVGSGILMLWLHGFDEAVGACMHQSPRADGFGRHWIVAAAAGVCRSTQTGSAAHSRPAPSAQTNSRSRLGCADADRRAPGAWARARSTRPC